MNASWFGKFVCQLNAATKYYRRAKQKVYIPGAHSNFIRDYTREKLHKVHNVT